MVETLKLKEENRIKKVIKIAETRMAVEREREREREREYLFIQRGIRLLDYISYIVI